MQHPTFQLEYHSRCDMQPIVQISLDLTSLEEALDTARLAVRAGVDWLEAGTPLLLAEGLNAVRGLRREFPKHPIVADLKTMDGGRLEAEMMAQAGATHVVVMGRAHRATLKAVVQAGRQTGHAGIRAARWTAAAQFVASDFSPAERPR